MKRQSQGGFLMAKIRQVGGRIAERILREYDIEITSAQGRIMFVLWQQDGVTMNELAKKTHLGKSTLTSMIDRLEKLGYVKRRRSETDRRKILIRRTEKDKVLESKYVEVSQEMRKLYYKGFTKSEISGFENALSRILINLTDFEAENE